MVDLSSSSRLIGYFCGIAVFAIVDDSQRLTICLHELTDLDRLYGIDSPLVLFSSEI